jgi:hypothetical protein
MRSQPQPLRLTASACAEHQAAQAPSTKWVHRQSVALEATRARALTARSVGIVEIGPARELRNRPSWLRIALQGWFERVTDSDFEDIEMEHGIPGSVRQKPGTRDGRWHHRATIDAGNRIIQHETARDVPMASVQLLQADYCAHIPTVSLVMCNRLETN